MVQSARASGVPVLILDPSCQNWHGADYVTANTDEFVQFVFANQRCLLIIDEAGEAIGHARSSDERQRITLATRTRHAGHSAIFISQFASTITPAIRRQCENLWTFRQSLDDVKMLSREFCNPKIMRAAELQKGECLHATTYGHAHEFRVLSMDIARRPVYDPKHEVGQGRVVSLKQRGQM